MGAFDYVDTRRRIVEQLAREYNVPVPSCRSASARCRSARRNRRRRPRRPPYPTRPTCSRERSQRNGTTVVVDRLESVDANALREFGDVLRSKAKSAAIVLGSVVDGTPNIVVDADAGPGRGRAARWKAGATARQDDGAPAAAAAPTSLPPAAKTPRRSMRRWPRRASCWRARANLARSRISAPRAGCSPAARRCHRAGSDRATPASTHRGTSPHA